MPQRVSDVLKEPFTQTNFLLPGLLPEQGKLLIGGRSKVGKSFLGLELALSLVRGVPFLGAFPVKTPHKVFLIQAEMPGKLFINARLRSLTKVCQNGALDRFYLEQTVDLRLDNGPDVARLKGWIESCNPDLTIVDPLYSVHTGSFNDAGAVAESLRVLNFLISSTHSAIALIAHFRKSFITSSGRKVPQDMEDILGSALFGAWADMIITVTPTAADDEDTVSPRRLCFWTRWLSELGTAEAQVQNEPPFFFVTKPSRKMKIMAELTKGKSRSASGIARRTGNSFEWTKRFLDSMVSGGALVKVGDEYVV